MDISNKKLVIATHYLVYGTAQALRDYLINNKAKKFLFIAHPLYTGEERSYFELIEKGKVKFKKKFPFRTRISIINYFIETLLTLRWVILSKGKYDLFVGADNLNASAGLILKMIGKVNKVVYDTIDYSPQRFKNSFLNSIYHKVDALCVKYADVVWNVSPRIQEGRKKNQGINFSGKQKVVPIGVWFNKVKRLPFNKIKKNQLLFLGNLLEKQGVQLVIEALPLIIKKIPNFHFLIIGGGQYEQTLKEKVREMKMNKHVTLTGWVKDRTKLDKLIPENACAIAPYDPDQASYTYYADPTKIKDYLSAGLPVILTNVPYNAKELEKKKCGVIVDYKKEDIAKAVIKIIGDEVKLKTYRENAVSYASQFDWDNIFGKALGEFQ